MVSLTVKASTPTPVFLKDRRAVWDGKLSTSGTYTTGGYSLPDNFKIKQNFKTVLNVTVEPKDGYQFYYDEDNSKIQVYLAQMEVMNGYALTISNARITVNGFK